MAETSLTKKLRILPGNRVLLLDAPDGYTRLLDPLPDGVTLDTDANGQYDVTQLFAADSSQLQRHLPDAIEATVPGGVLWVCYQKKTSGKGDLNRDLVWELVKPTGWGPVTQIALDDTWSALRFRPEADVKRKSRE